MSTTTDGDPGKEVTLAFSRAALEQLADPAAVFADARGWSRYVGLIDNDPASLATVAEEHDLRQDYELGDRDKWLALADVREATAGDTPRHVYVGETEDDRLAAGRTGWEFVHVTVAAEEAGWSLADETGPGTASTGVSGLLDRVRRWIR